MLADHSKATAPPLAIDHEMVYCWREWQNDRTVILLASSHPGEDEIVIEAVEAIQQSEAILLILTPRHIERGKAIQAMLSGHDIPAFLLSQNTWPDSMADKRICMSVLLISWGKWAVFIPCRRYYHYGWWFYAARWS